MIPHFLLVGTVLWFDYNLKQEFVSTIGRTRVRVRGLTTWLLIACRNQPPLPPQITLGGRAPIVAAQ